MTKSKPIVLKKPTYDLSDEDRLRKRMNVDLAALHKIKSLTRRIRVVKRYLSCKQRLGILCDVKKDNVPFISLPS